LVAAHAVAALAQVPPNKATSGIPHLPSVEELSATVERPLFMTNRRPPAAPPPVATADASPVDVPSEEAPADLTGIVSGPERTYAILTNKATKEIVHLRQGEKIDEWSIQEIGARYVVLRRGPGSLRLELFAEKDADEAHDGKPAARRPPTQNMRPRFTPQMRLRQQQTRQQSRQPQRTRPRPNRRPTRRGDDD
jgi:hypothetical protein